MEDNLRNKTLKGVGWTAAQSVVSHGVGFVIGIILARLLSPEAYGMVGMVMVVQAILGIFVDGNFGASLIRKPKVTEEDYNTMFWMTLGMSLAAYTLLFVFAPLLSTFFNAELTSLARVLGLTMVIGSLSAAQGAKMTKEINFKPFTYSQVISSVLGGIAGVICAFCGLGVWALVVQNLLSSILSVTYLFIVSPWKPCLSFSAQSAKYMWGFGWRLTLTNLLGAAWNRIYVLVVGKFYAMEALGQYSRARSYAELLSVNLTNVVERVAYPTLSNIQEEPEHMIAVYRRMIKVTMFVTTISLFFLAAISKPFIICLIGEKWMDAARYLPYICMAVSLFPLWAVNKSMLKIIGRPDLYMRVFILSKSLDVGPILIGIFYGIMPMLISVIFARVAAFFIYTYYVGREVKYSTLMQMKDVAPSYAVAICVALSVYFFKFLPLSPFVILPIQLFIGGIAFFAICEIFKPIEYKELRSIVLQVYHKYKP